MTRRMGRDIYEFAFLHGFYLECFIYPKIKLNPKNFFLKADPNFDINNSK